MSERVSGFRHSISYPSHEVTVGDLWMTVKWRNRH